ncbi:MAG TPA: hypothetical protein VMV45_11120 [Casimicrobiaceae bacterium]|nr:hypothetical protein [Casimicrobiaceae bacterium]
MNRSPVAVVAAVLLLGGCASAPLTKADVDGRVVCDRDKMDQVEHAARRERRDITWIHCPTAVLRAG